MTTTTAPSTRDLAAKIVELIATTEAEFGRYRIASWSDLHDEVDANEYVRDAVEELEWALDLTSPDAVEVVNGATDLVDLFLHLRIRPGTFTGCSTPAESIDRAVRIRAGIELWYSELICDRCGQTFIPAGENDLVHVETLEGVECLGLGVSPSVAIGRVGKLSVRIHL